MRTRNLAVGLAAVLLVAAPPRLFSALRLSVGEGSERLSAPSGKGGATVVADGNAKGQTFTVPKPGVLRGVVFL